MPALQPFLIAGLKNYEAYFVCNAAIGLVGDFSRGLEEKLQPYCNEIMGALIDALRDDSVHRSVKPTVFSTFAEIALAIGASYEPYLQYSLMLLLQAATTQAPSDDEDFIEYINMLRESILEAYTGIIQGLKGGNRMDLFLPYAQSVLQFLQVIADDPNRDDLVLSKAVGLVGDVASSMGPHVKDQLNQPYVAQLLQEAEAMGDENTMETAQWTRSIIEGLIRGN
jgi:importin subunit beta-1